MLQHDKSEWLNTLLSLKINVDHKQIHIQQHTWCSDKQLQPDNQTVIVISVIYDSRRSNQSANN